MRLRCALQTRPRSIDTGGFASWNLVEDLTTSYELHSRGWRSFYYPHAVSLGLAPADIWGVYRQRGQWALDTMRLFFWDNPLFKRGLPWQGRMSYLVIPLTYFGAGFIFPFLFLIPVVDLSDRRVRAIRFGIRVRLFSAACTS